MKKFHPLFGLTLLLAGVLFAQDSRAQDYTRLEGHTSSVSSVAFSPDGKTLASGSTWEIRLWDVETGQVKHTLTEHSDRVYSVAFSPDGKTLASGSWDNTVRLWDVETGQVKITLTGHSDNVWSVAFSPDGNTLASGGGDGTVLLWDTSAWTKTGSDTSIGTDRPDELIGKWKSVISDDEAETTSVLEFDANGRFMYSEKTTSHESLKQNLIREFGADPGRIQFVADSLAARKSRFRDALVADKQMSGTEMRGTWGVWGNAIHVVVDSFSLSFNGLQGNDIFEFLETIIPLVVPAKNVGFVEFLFLLTFTFLQETFNALVEAREIFEIGTYFFENDNLILVQDESQIRYTRVSEMITPDFDGDGTVGITDFLLFVDQFGLSQGDAGYDARFDLDGDGVIGISDFLIFVNAFGQKGG